MELSVMTVQEIAKAVNKDPSGIHRMLKTPRWSHIERRQMVSQPSGQTVVVVSRADGEALIQFLSPGLHEIPARAKSTSA
jgi:hypothetical protein